jgi:hypothetical protein
VHITKRSLAILLFVAALLGGLTAGGLSLLVQRSTPSASAPAANTSPPPAVSTPPTTPPKASPAADDGTGAELQPGSKGNEYDRSYRCKAGFESVQVPVGKTVQKDGAVYTLDEKRASYGDQTSVTFHVKLAANVSAPTLIVNTGAHNLGVAVYPQSLINAALQAGGTGDWTFQTGAYAENYRGAGITDVTACTLSKKKPSTPRHGGPALQARPASGPYRLRELKL